MSKKYIIATEKISKHDEKLVYLYERISDGKFGAIYVKWTENIEEAKLFNSQQEAEQYDKSRIGHSLDSYDFLNVGFVLNPNLKILELVGKEVSTLPISYEYRRI